MSDNEEIEVEASGYAVLPKEVTDEIGSVKLFNKWSYEDVEIRDISLTLDTPNPSALCHICAPRS
jgi:small subunit ribosomal protein S5e